MPLKETLSLLGVCTFSDGCYHTHSHSRLANEEKCSLFKKIDKYSILKTGKKILIKNNTLPPHSECFFLSVEILAKGRMKAAFREWWFLTLIPIILLVRL